MEYIFIAIIVIVVCCYLAVLYMRKNYAQKITEYQSELEKLQACSLEKKLASISQLNLTGESLTEFEKLDKGYRYLLNRQLPELSETLNLLQETNSQMHVFSVKQDMATIDKKIENVSQRFNEIRNDLEKIERDTKEQQRAVDSLDERYHSLRKVLLAKSFSFGPALDVLEDTLGELEKDFDAYVKLMESGDYVAAAPSLQSLKMQTSELQNAIEQIPPLYKNYHNVFPEQIKELQAALAQMQDQGHGFSDDMGAKLTQINQQMTEFIENITSVNIEDSKKINDQLMDEIDAVYDVFEKEYSAKAQLEAKEKYYFAFFKHAKQQQYELLVALERLKQNYTLTHNELEDARILNEQLDRIEEQQHVYLEQKEQKKAIYSQELTLCLNNIEALTEIEQKQKQINDGVANLWHEEKEARKAVESFDLQIHQLKRRVEKLNLPGLTKEYLGYFYRVAQEIKDLSQALRCSQINMDEITKGLLDTQSDLDVLETKTNELIDSSLLTEEMLQYANRYRNRYPEIADAYQKALKLFNEDYDYVAALDTISHAVDNVDPGAFSKISKAYEEQKELI